MFMSTFPYPLKKTTNYASNIYCVQIWTLRTNNSPNRENKTLEKYGDCDTNATQTMTKRWKGPHPDSELPTDKSSKIPRKNSQLNIFPPSDTANFRTKGGFIIIYVFMYFLTTL
jgi:hypothetical protein